MGTMGDSRFARYYESVAHAENPVEIIASMTDEDVVCALAAASRAEDPYVANVLATEALNRTRASSAITRTIGDGVCALTVDGSITFVNPAACAILGWEPDHLIGMPFHDALHFEGEDGKPRSWEDSVIRRTLATGRMSERHGDVFARRDGTRVPVEFTVTAYLREDEVAGGVVVFRDVTERRKADEAERAFSRQQAAVARLGMDALNDAPLSTLFDRALDAVLATCELEDACILESDAEGLFTPLAARGRTGRLRGEPPDAARLGTHLMDAYETGRSIRVVNYGEDSPLYPPACLVRAGVRSGIAVPIATESGSIGILAAFGPEPDGIAGADEYFLQSIANIIGTAIERDRFDRERSRLLHQERRARDRAEHAEAANREHAEREHILSQVSRRLAISPLEKTALLEEAVRLVTQFMGDGAAVAELSPDGTSLIPCAMDHVDPDVLDALKDAVGTQPLEESLGKIVLQSNKAINLADLDPRRFDFLAESDDRRISENLENVALMVAPLIVDGSVMGTLSVWRSTPAPAYTETARQLFEEVADRTALALSNARAFRKEADARERVEHARQERDEVTRALETTESRIRGIVQAAPAGIMVSDPEGVITFANEAAAHMLGVPSSELVGLDSRNAPWQIETVDHTPIDPRTILEQAIRGVAHHGELSLVRPDGGQLYIQSSGSPILDADGQCSGAAFAFVDVSDRVTMAKRLGASEEFYRALATENPHMVLSIDLEGRFLSANSAIRRILDHAPEDVIGKPFLPLVAEEDRERVMLAFGAMIRGERLEVPAGALHRDGHRIPVVAEGIPIRVGGVIVGVHVIVKEAGDSAHTSDRVKIAAPGTVTRHGD